MRAEQTRERLCKTTKNKKKLCARLATTAALCYHNPCCKHKCFWEGYNDGGATYPAGGLRSAARCVSEGAGGQAAAGLRYGQQHFAGGPPGRDLPQRVL